jgi:hypothetical protein
VDHSTYDSTANLGRSHLARIASNKKWTFARGAGSPTITNLMVAEVEVTKEARVPRMQSANYHA